jgi:uncharacterized protein Yka (UPF0111/DUF47 family)
MTMSDQKRDDPGFDPFGPYIQFTDSWVKSWSDVLSKTVASPEVAETMGQQLEVMLEAGKLMRQQTRLLMEQVMDQTNLPSRDQVVSLAERLTHVEMRVDDIEAKVDESLDLLKAIQAALTKHD